MKISELTRLNNVRRDMEIPIAVEGENFNVTFGQMSDALNSNVVYFSARLPRPEHVQFVEEAPISTIGGVVYDEQDGKFYLARPSKSEVAGQSVTVWTYFVKWPDYDSYYKDNGEVRQDCIFVSLNQTDIGRMYIYSGNSLKSAGITDAQSEQIRLSTPIEVASEEEMEQRIASGEYEDGQIYFLAES